MMIAKRWDLDIQCSGTNFNVMELSQDGLVLPPYLLYNHLSFAAFDKKVYHGN